MRLSSIMEADETMGEDARSIAYFDMCVSLRPFPPNVVRELMGTDMFMQDFAARGPKRSIFDPEAGYAVGR
jgi:hypothetical protein